MVKNKKYNLDNIDDIIFKFNNNILSMAHMGDES